MNDSDKHCAVGGDRGGALCCRWGWGCGCGLMFFGVDCNDLKYDDV